VLPPPPSDSEKYAYIHRNLPYLTFTLVVSATCLILSQIRFEMHAPGSWPFLAFTATYVIYQVISLPVNFTGRGFDLAARKRASRPGGRLVTPVSTSTSPSAASRSRCFATPGKRY
jgi:hypothetical protein